MAKFRFRVGCNVFDLSSMDYSVYKSPFFMDITEYVKNGTQCDIRIPR